MFSTGPFLGSPHKLDTTIPPTLFLMLTLAAPPQKKSVIAAISHPRLFYILYIHVGSTQLSGSFHERFHSTRGTHMEGSIWSSRSFHVGSPHSPGNSIKKLVHFLPFIKKYGYFSFHSEATKRQFFFSVKFRDLPLSFGKFS